MFTAPCCVVNNANNYVSRSSGNFWRTAAAVSEEWSTRLFVPTGPEAKFSAATARCPSRSRRREPSLS